MIKSYSKLKRLNKEKFKVPKSTQDIIQLIPSTRMVFFVWETNIPKAIAF